MFGRKGRKTPFQRETDEALEDLRDDCIALFVNSGLLRSSSTSEEARPPSTISKWLYKETHFPRANTILTIAQVLGARLTVVDAKVDDIPHSRNERLNLAVPYVGKPKMARRA